MRTANTMLKSALMTLALATASAAAFTSTARAADEQPVSAEATPGKESAASVDGPTALPRPTPPVLEDAATRADLNRDGTHNMDDLVLLLMSWGSCPAADSVCSADINLDREVNENDLLYLLRLIGLDSNQSL